MTDNASWVAYKGRPVRQSNFGRYKTLVSRGTGRTHETVGITADTAELCQEVAENAANAAAFLSALQDLIIICEENVKPFAPTSEFRKRLESHIRVVKLLISKSKGE